MKDSELPQIPQADPRRRFLARRREIEGAVARVLDRGTFILVPEAAAFEAEFATLAGTRSPSRRAPTRCASTRYLLRHAQLLAASFDVIDPSYCPWRDHPEPRWWRKPRS